MFGNHGYAFDPNYGYSLNDLLAVSAPACPLDYAEFWQTRYQLALALPVLPVLRLLDEREPYRVYEIEYPSSEGFLIKGWLLVPAHGKVKRGFVVGHGYGGREEPDWHLPFSDAALLFPCFRGLGRSVCQSVSAQPEQHVLSGIEHRDHYIIGGCVDDLWLSVSVLLQLYPEISGRIGYLGISFGGGVGALAVSWDDRIVKAHFNVPTFGHQPLRLQLATAGSAYAVQSCVQHQPDVIETLRYFDAALSARFAKQPALFALAKFDPYVAPPGQFAIYNAWSGPKQLFLMDAGHFAYPEQETQDDCLLDELKDFFSFE
ncbi:MAG: deacetylase [Methylococcaceae bacterium]|nr:deacetylase [Methylococcaceae bacterium]